jgi:hypothetical protein
MHERGTHMGRMSSGLSASRLEEARANGTAATRRGSHRGRTTMVAANNDSTT